MELPPDAERLFDMMNTRGLEIADALAEADIPVDNLSLGALLSIAILSIAKQSGVDKCRELCDSMLNAATVLNEREKPGASWSS
jgi:hypothetical protein